jgi:hypothetical protein
MSTGPDSPDRDKRPRFKGPPPVPAGRPAAAEQQWKAAAPPPPSGAWRPTQPPPPRQAAPTAVPEEPFAAVPEQPVRVASRRPLRTKRRSDTAGILAIMVMLLAAAGGLGYYFLLQRQKDEIAAAVQAARSNVAADAPAAVAVGTEDAPAVPAVADVQPTPPAVRDRDNPRPPPTPDPLDVVSATASPVAAPVAPPVEPAMRPTVQPAATDTPAPPPSAPPMATASPAGPDPAPGSPPAAVDKAVAEAFAAMRGGDFDTAASRLKDVSAGDDGQVQARLDRWRQFLHYARGMVDLRKRALAEAADGREYELGDRVIVIVEMNDRQVIYRDRGKQHEVPRDKLPQELEQAIVEQWLAGDGRAANHLFLGAGHLLREIPSPADAVREWQTAAAGGERDGQLLQPLARDPALFAP